MEALVTRIELTIASEQTITFQGRLHPGRGLMTSLPHPILDTSPWAV